MKKYLLGTSALIAAGALSGAAYAQSASDPIKLSLGGYWRGAAGTVLDQGAGGGNSSPTFGKHHTSFDQDSVVQVSGTTKLDNGLNVGVVWQFRGEAAATTLDTEKRSYVRFFGDFGEVRFGDDDDSRVQKSFTAPTAGSLFGVNSPFFEFTNSPIGSNSTTSPVTTKRAMRIAYFSPTIAGFSFAASYAPNSQKGTLLSPGFQTANDAGQNSQSWSIAGLYDNKFGDFHLQAYSGYTGSRLEKPVAGAAGAANVSAFNVGATLGWGPIQVGSTYQHLANARQAATTGSNLNNNTYDLGALYTIGPFSTSLDFSHGSYRGGGGASAGAIAAVATGSEAVLNQFALVADYVLGPGISVGAALQFDSYRSGITPIAGVASSNNEHDTTFMVGTALTF